MESKKKGDPQLAFASKRGPLCVCKRRGVRKTKEKKKRMNQVSGKRDARVGSRKKAPLAFASKRGPLCIWEKSGTVRREERKSKTDVRYFGNSRCQWGEKSGRSGETRQSHEQW